MGVYLSITTLSTSIYFIHMVEIFSNVRASCWSFEIVRIAELYQVLLVFLPLVLIMSQNFLAYQVLILSFDLTCFHLLQWSYSSHSKLEESIVGRACNLITPPNKSLWSFVSVLALKNFIFTLIDSYNRGGGRWSVLIFFTTKWYKEFKRNKTAMLKFSSPLKIKTHLKRWQCSICKILVIILITLVLWWRYRHS